MAKDYPELILMIDRIGMEKECSFITGNTIIQTTDGIILGGGSSITGNIITQTTGGIILDDE